MAHMALVLLGSQLTNDVIGGFGVPASVLAVFLGIVGMLVSVVVWSLRTTVKAIVKQNEKSLAEIASQLREVSKTLKTINEELSELIDKAEAIIDMLSELRGRS